MQEAEIRGRSERFGFLFRYAACAREGDFTGASGLQMLGIAREIERLLESKRGSGRLGFTNRIGDDLMTGFGKEVTGVDEEAFANQHHGIGGRQAI